MRLQPRRPGEGPFSRRHPVLGAVVVSAFGVLLIRLMVLQVGHGNRFEDLSTSNFRRTVDVSAPRGRILDRHGLALADNAPAWSVHVTPRFVDDPEALLQKLRTLLGLPPAEEDRVRRIVTGTRGLARFREAEVAAVIDRDSLGMVMAAQDELPGVSIRRGLVRVYPLAEVAGNLTGYLGRIGEEELARCPHCPRDGLVGRAGVERSMEERLRGAAGHRTVTVDSFGRVREEMAPAGPEAEGDLPARAGEDIRLTIDARLQQAAWEAAGQDNRAVVALDVRTGEVLAMVSRPAPDPNLFAAGIEPDLWSRYTNDSANPLVDKTAMAVWPPASTWKPVIAIAGLEEGTIGTASRFECTGGLRRGRLFRCWKLSGHGDIDLASAMMQSCDVYFWRVAEQIDADRIASWARRFGFGQPTGIGLVPEASGLVPDRAWHGRVYREAWKTGATLVNAIGQGDTRTTLLQLARFYAAIANGGRLLRPSLLAGEGNPADAVPIGLRPSSLEAVRHGLEGVVNHPRGTAYRSRSASVQVAGKTGTAQVVEQWRGDTRLQHEGFRTRDHALFAGYAPADRPEIVVVVLAEHAGHGGSEAAPIAMEVFERYFEMTRAIPAVTPTGPRPDTPPSPSP